MLYKISPNSQFQFVTPPYIKSTAPDCCLFQGTSLHQATIFKSIVFVESVVVVVVVVVVVLITPPLPQDGGMARTAIQVHAVNIIEIRLGERWQPILNQS